MINNTTINRTSYNGGNGGLRARANEQEQRFEREQHLALARDQTSHQATARAKPELRVARNKGKPPIAATPRPAAFDAPDVVPAKDADTRQQQRQQAQRQQQARDANQAQQPPQPSSQRQQQERQQPQSQNPPRGPGPQAEPKTAPGKGKKPDTDREQDADDNAQPAALRL